MSQKETLLKMFKECGNRLRLREIMQTHLAAEYRARISELRREGYHIICTPGKTPSENLYTLIEVKPGELRLDFAHG